MTKEEAIIKLRQSIDLVFEVESQMDIIQSLVRRKGYYSRLSIEEFINAIKCSPKKELENV